MNEKDRDFLRFLWIDGGSEEECKVAVFRFLRVVFGITSSPFLLNGTIRHHLEKYVDFERSFVERFIEDLYVDDLTSGCSTVEEGVEIYNKGKSIMNDAGFNLRKWKTNDTKLQDIFDKKEGKLLDNVVPIDDITYSETLNDSIVQNQKVLGLEWDTNTDEFVYRFDSFIQKANELPPTKRNVLRVAASFYDPLGLISPITTRVKLIFRLLCKDKYEWDDVISNDIKTLWFEFLNELHAINLIRVKRYVICEPNHVIQSIQLHAFSDSSMKAYAGAVYVRIKTNIGIGIALLASKSKVAPLKTLSIPRLELLGCSLLTKLLKEVKLSISERIEVESVYGWCDSEVVLCWLKGKSKNWKPWVENRVVLIREVLCAESWFYVASGDNPADIPSRAVCLEGLVKSMWFDGPRFLYKDRFDLLKFDVDEKLKLPGVVSEAKKSVSDVVTNFVVGEVGDEGVSSLAGIQLHKIINVENFSSLEKLINVTGYVLRFINNLMNKRRKNLSAVVNGTTLTSYEYNNSLKLWIITEQNILRHDTQFEKLKQSLSIFEDSNIVLRIKGRFENSHLSYEEKHPALLRSGSYFTLLVVRNVHNLVYHQGVEATLNKFRCNYWITQGRKNIKNILRKCITCKRLQAKTVKPPPSPDLPEYRVYSSYPFETTGLDYAGPLFVREANKNVSKVYILLLTCATSRAIHLELSVNMKSPGFLRSFRRFTARRGNPKLIVNDNFKTFKSDPVKRYMNVHGISRNYILPASPWWGGFYERLVRSVKSALKKTLGKTLLTYEELETVLCEIEESINSRPLIYMSEDDVEESITPFHLMFGRNISNRSNNFKNPVASEIENVSYCIKRVKYVGRIINQCWKRFNQSYLNELRQHNMYRKENVKSNANKLVKGDVVLIRDDNKLPRNQWRLGKIESLVVGNEGNVRGAQLTSISKCGKRTNAFRPVQKLIPLEITNGENIDDNKNADSNTEEDKNDINKNSLKEETDNVNKRPRRKAANDGEEIRRLREKYN